MKPILAPAAARHALATFVLTLAATTALAQGAGPIHGGHGGHGPAHDSAGHGADGGGMHGGGRHRDGGMHGGGGGMHGGGMRGGGMHGGALGGPTHLGQVFEHALRDARPSDEQQRQIDRVVEATRKKNWPLFDQLLEERARLKALYAAQPRDLKAIKAGYRRLAELQVRIAENRLDAFEEVGRLLAAEQRSAFEAHVARHFSRH